MPWFLFCGKATDLPDRALAAIDDHENDTHSFDLQSRKSRVEEDLRDLRRILVSRHDDGK